MQSSIHPAYGPVQVTCTCGHKFTAHSALGAETFSIDVCNECHPFYTGKQKIVDTAGRVDKFSKKFGGFSLNKDNADEKKQ